MIHIVRSTDDSFLFFILLQLPKLTSAMPVYLSFLGSGQSGTSPRKNTRKSERAAFSSRFHEQSPDRLPRFFRPVDTRRCAGHTPSPPPTDRIFISYGGQQDRRGWSPSVNRRKEKVSGNWCYGHSPPERNRKNCSTDRQRTRVYIKRYPDGVELSGLDRNF